MACWVIEIANFPTDYTNLDFQANLYFEKLHDAIIQLINGTNQHSLWEYMHVISKSSCSSKYGESSIVSKTSYMLH